MTRAAGAFQTLSHRVAFPHAGASDGDKFRSAGNGTSADDGAAVSVHDKLKRALKLWDVVGITIGTIIGSGIFASANRVLKQAGSVGHMLMVWVCR
jgi:amino acid permease